MKPGGYRALAAALRQGGRVVRKTWLDAANLGRAEMREDASALVSDAAGRLPQTMQQGGEIILVERFDREKSLLLCGGGHVSRPVSMLSKMLGYRVLVMDDRAEFATRERFPDADEIACGDFTALLAQYPWENHPDTSVVILTRGHVADTACLRAVIRRDLPYIGMIGSRKKNLEVLEVMRREGVSEAQIARVHAPIGLPIGGRTPEEIAVSIAAELISTRQGMDRSAFSEAMLDALLRADATGGIMATIVRKQGSTPRDVGARMLFLPSGEVLGTIGGGLPEHEVMLMAQELLKSPRPAMKHFNMGNGEAGKSGLICGGMVDVLFEVIA